MVAREAKECYAKGSTATDGFNEEEFKCLMFLDGCFVVYFIHCIICNRLDLPITKNYLTFISLDLFLLENQIPYAVLRVLVTDLMPTEHHNDIEEFIVENYTAIEGRRTGRESPLCRNVRDCCKSVLDLVFKRKKQPTNATEISSEASSSSSSSLIKEEPQLLHLLDFLRTKLIDDTESSPPNINPTKKLEGSSSSLKEEDPLHRPESLLTKLIDNSESSPPNSQQNDDGDNSDDWESFRSVVELKVAVAGIKCVTSGSSCVKKIKFIPHTFLGHSHLSFPAISIDDSYKTLWLNLVAYEACPDFFNDRDITSFICFMDSLIDGPEDVKELRLQGVLQNFLGSDKHVAGIFNELNTDLAPNSWTYRKVKRDIQKHFNKKCSVWFAELMHTHFSSPWTVIAFLAALYVLVLSTISTFF
ncbi:UPF0481 protein At3g47200-like [Telopea speciosissima]|uniref:UPF0481 protein At3g47200-like n=1 Tax=Telopea speciosissima TaxID=54955 RepID=UPI001CC7D8C7|nr:UPF0481 protein At3g47200-like [Telopea speciosissima]